MTTTTRVRPEVMVNPSAASDRRRDLSTSSATLLSPCLVPSKHTKKDATPLSPQSMSNLTLLDAMGGHIGSDDDEARLLEEFSQSLRASMRTKKLSPTSDSRLQKEFNRALNATIQSTQSRKNMVLDTHLKPPNDGSKTEHPDILSASPSKFVSLDEAIPVFWHPRVREASRSSSPAELFTSEELAFIEQARTRSFMANTSHSRPSNTNQPQSPTPSTAWENASTKAIHYDQSRSESRTESLNASLYVLSGSPARTHTAQTSPKSHSREEAGSPDHLRTGSPTNGKAHNRSSTGASSPYDPDYFPVEAQVQTATDDFSEFQVHTLSYSAKLQEEAMSSSSHAEMRSRSPSPSFNISGEHHKSPSLSLRSTDGVHIRSPSPSLKNSEHVVIMGLSPHRSGYSSPTIRNVRLGSGASERSASPELRMNLGQGTQDARTLAFTALTSEQPQEIVHPSVVASPRRPKSPPLAVESLHPDQSSKSSPSPHHAVPNPNEELEQRLLLALDDLERHRTALSRTRSDLIARDAEIDKLKWERRRMEEDFLEEREGLLQKVHLGKVDIGRVEERLRKDGEERVREVEVKLGGLNEELKFKLNDSLSTIAALEKELELAQQQMYEVSQRQQQALTSGISGVEHSRLIELIKDLKAENGELKEMLQQEKTKNARSEEEFRMFSRKLRTLQDTNGELRNENETLRTELRKMQYEGQANDNSRFYKEKLEQSLYDIESLKAVARTLGEQNDQLRSLMDMKGVNAPREPMPSSSPPRRSASPPAGIPSFFLGSTSPSSSRSVGRRHSSSQLGSKSAWDGRRSFSIDESVNDADRSRYQEKIRLFEETPQQPDHPDTQSTPVGVRTFGENVLPAGYSTQTVGRRASNPLTWTESTPKVRSGVLGGGSLTSSTSGTPKLRARNASTVGVLLGGEEKGMMEYAAVKTELEGQLRSLNEQKMTLTAELQRIPTSGSGSGRRRKEEVDDRLDEVERLIGTVKMKMRNMHML